MIRTDNSPKHKLQKRFQLLKFIWRKRRLFTVKGTRICRLNFRRSHRVRGPFLESSGNYWSPISYPSVTKQNGLLFVCLFVSFICFVYLFVFLSRTYAVIVQILFWIFGSGLKSCGTLSLRNGPLVSAHVLGCIARDGEEEGFGGERKEKCNWCTFRFWTKKKTLLEQQVKFWVVALSMKVQWIYVCKIEAVQLRREWSKLSSFSLERFKN